MKRFKFIRSDMQQKLEGLLQVMGVVHSVDQDGFVVTDEADALLLDDLASAVRTSVFPSWCTFCTTTDEGMIDAELRQESIKYLNENGIGFAEEIDDEHHWFLLREGTEIPESIYEEAVRRAVALEQSTGE